MKAGKQPDKGWDATTLAKEDKQDLGPSLYWEW
jgi:hypothetical protein